MEFFTSHDWLNRPGPKYAFQLDHILFIVISMLIGVGLCFLCYRMQKKKKNFTKIVLISLWGLAVAVELLYYGYTYTMCIVDPTNNPFKLEGMLPFHSCLMFLYVFPFAVFSKNKIIRTSASNFLVIINMIIGFITLFVGCPGPGYSALSFNGFQSLLLHALIVITPMIMVATNYYDIQIGDIKYGLILFGILSVIMWTFDAITGCDYFYFYDGHTFPVLKVISENVHHLIWTLIVVSCYVITGCAMHFLIIWIKYLVNKRKTSE